MNTKQVLKKAAEYIKWHGWCQGVYTEPFTNRVCASQAIIEGARICRKETGPGNDHWNYLVDAAREEFAEYLTGYDSIVQWNDLPGRTKEEVIATLEKAAEE